MSTLDEVAVLADSRRASIRPNFSCATSHTQWGDEGGLDGTADSASLIGVAGLWVAMVSPALSDDTSKLP